MNEQLTVHARYFCCMLIDACFGDVTEAVTLLRCCTLIYSHTCQGREIHLSSFKASLLVQWLQRTLTWRYLLASLPPGRLHCGLLD